MNTISEKQNHLIAHSLLKPQYVIAIGGSAGFLKPLLEFFQNTKTDDVSYVVLRHIGSNVQSELAKIIRLHSSLKIIEADYNMKVEKNTVYVLPPGFYMTIKDEHFHLQKRRGPVNCAIDIFMESLANEYKEKSIGIILSGSGSNGTNGIINIKKAGGYVIVQQPSSCEFAYMPASAIKTGCVDDIALPEEMPEIIREYTELRQYKRV
jgi:two-component system CheB/CheR fusion protein